MAFSLKKHPDGSRKRICEKHSYDTRRLLDMGNCCCRSWEVLNKIVSGVKVHYILDSPFCTVLSEVHVQQKKINPTSNCALLL